MNRKKSREKAMEILFGMYLSKDSKEDAIETYKENYEDSLDGVDFNYIDKTIEGVLQNENEIEKSIEKNLKNWKLDRIAKVNLTILKIAVYEMKFAEDVPEKVAINEALDLAKKYSDEKSIPFINGVLDNIFKES